MGGALIINKPPGITSFGVIERLQDAEMRRSGVKRRDLPKLGHGGTLDPFATGVLLVCVGEAVKLARYFLGSRKRYAGVIRFGETTIPGDPTAPVSERALSKPDSLEQIRGLAHRLTLTPYEQIPPMHSAKKVDGRPLYELAHQGIEIAREPKTCTLFEFEIGSYDGTHAEFALTCSAGTYVRTLAQDLGRAAGSLAMLDSLVRTYTGGFSLTDAWSLDRIEHAMTATAEASPASSTENRIAGAEFEELGCFVPFDRLLINYRHARVSQDEAIALARGDQSLLAHSSGLHRRVDPALEALVSEGSECLPLITEGPLGDRLVAVARREGEESAWGLDRVFYAARSTPRLERAYSS